MTNQPATNSADKRTACTSCGKPIGWLGDCLYTCLCNIPRKEKDEAENRIEAIESLAPDQERLAVYIACTEITLEEFMKLYG